MFWLAAIAWWVLGAGTMIWLRRGDGLLTWGSLTFSLLLGIFGPVLLLMIGFVILVEADFWDKPVFGRRNNETVE